MMLWNTLEGSTTVSALAIDGHIICYTSNNTCHIHSTAITWGESGPRQSQSTMMQGHTTALSALHNTPPSFRGIVGK
jgi:hypothetical protein